MRPGLISHFDRQTLIAHLACTVFETIHREINAAGADALIPLGNSHLSEGVATDEVENVVARRNGRILSAATILKS